MSRTKRIVFSLLALTIGLGVALVFAEGVFSLFRNRSLVRHATASGGAIRLRMTDDERAKAAALTPGPYAAHLDPFVGYKLKPSFRDETLGEPWSTDARSFRTRIGAAPSPGATRILVLGDSVAFGTAVRDDQTLAHWLEEWLASTLAADAPRPYVRTLAAPGLNFQDQKRMFLDVIGEERWDIVIQVPVINDLDDALTVYETGHRNVDIDKSRGADHPHMSLQDHFVLREHLAALGRLSAHPDAETLQPVLYTGLTPESRGRYAVMVAGMEELDRRVAAAGGRYLLAFPQRDLMNARLRQWLVDADSPVTRTWLFHAMPEDYTLVVDPHPNVATLREMGRRVAAFMIDAGWLVGADRRALPEATGIYVDNEEPEISKADLVAERVEADRLFTRQTSSRIDLGTGLGFHQVYGGIHADGGVGISCAVALRAPEATSIHMTLIEVQGRPGLYPLDLRVLVNGTEVGIATLPGPDPTTPRPLAFRFDLPVEVRGASWLDVHVKASNWTAEKVADTTRLVSFKLATLAAR